MTDKKSLGSKLLQGIINKRQISYQTVAEEITKQGHVTQRYSVWQWAHGISRPTMGSAYALAAWSNGDIQPEAWLTKSAKKMDELRTRGRTK